MNPLHKIDSTNKVTTRQFEYVCRVLAVGSDITVNITIKILIVKINSRA